MAISNLSAQQLRRAASLRERIDKLENALAAILNWTGEAQVKAKPSSGLAVQSKPKRRISKAARAKMAASAKKRWAKAKAAGKKSL